MALSVPPPKKERQQFLYVKLATAAVDALAPAFPWMRAPEAGQRRGNRVAVLRAVLHSLVTFFDAPAPAQRVLEDDMKAQGIPHQFAYVRWLIARRAEELTQHQQHQPAGATKAAHR